MSAPPAAQVLRYAQDDTLMKVYIVGFMAAGKTTVGRELASRIGVPFFDLDELIESSEQMTVKDIFATHGEPYFRKRERDILRSTKHLDRGVIATGGGTFCFDENVQFIQSEGLSVYLSAPYAVLRGRVGSKSAERPLFRDDVAAHELYGSRIRYYRMCDITIEMRDDETPAEIVERLVFELPKGLLVRRSG
jgi:shikimate kinase